MPKMERSVKRVFANQRNLSRSTIFSVTLPVLQTFHLTLLALLTENHITSFGEVTSYCRQTLRKVFFHAYLDVKDVEPYYVTNFSRVL